MVTPLLIGLFLVGFIAAAVLGTQTYFMGEQSKPIHDRNWRSAGFHRLASIFTGREIDYSLRASSYRAELSLQKVLN